MILNIPDKWLARTDLRPADKLLLGYLSLPTNERVADIARILGLPERTAWRSLRRLSTKELLRSRKIPSQKQRGVRR